MDIFKKGIIEIHKAITTIETLKHSAISILSQLPPNK